MVDHLKMYCVWFDNPQLDWTKKSMSPQADAQPVLVETTQPETVELQRTSSPKPEVVLEDSPPAQAETRPDTPKKQKKKQAASPKLVQLNQTKACVKSIVE